MASSQLAEAMLIQAEVVHRGVDRLIVALRKQPPPSMVAALQQTTKISGDIHVLRKTITALETRMQKWGSLGDKAKQIFKNPQELTQITNKRNNIANSHRLIKAELQMAEKALMECAQVIKNLQ